MKNTVLSLMKMKESCEKISMLTCYDYSTARLMESSGINMILVGDYINQLTTRRRGEKSASFTREESRRGSCQRLQ